MRQHFNLAACVLAFTFSLLEASAIKNKANSTASFEQNNTITGLRGVPKDKARLLQVTEEITGAFDIVTLVRFNDVTGGWFQRVFDFGNGAQQDNVWLGQVGSSATMGFEIWVGNRLTRCEAPNAIVQGELATWKAGVNRDGTQWIEKNGNRVCTIQGQIPRNIVRANKLIGQSNWGADTPLKGAVVGIDITNAGEVRDARLLNKPDQIRGAFDISVQARFDAPQAGRWQRVFDFGNGAEQDNIVLGQYDNTNDMSMEIWRNGVRYNLIAPGAIKAGELATWKVGVTANGLMWMEKSGTRVAQGQGTVPANVQRNSNLLGSSNWGGANALLDGVVLGLTVSPAGSLPSPVPLTAHIPNQPAPIPNQPAPISNQPGSAPANQIQGPFVITVQARYDNPQGGSWQRVFNFGIGIARDNVWLGQLANTNDMVFEIWKNSVMYRLVAHEAITTGQLTTWRVGVDANGLMWMEKSGIRIGQRQGVVPAAIQRNSNVSGPSNRGGDAPLDGVVLGLSISNVTSVAVPDSMPAVEMTVPAAVVYTTVGIEFPIQSN